MTDSQLRLLNRLLAERAELLKLAEVIEEWWLSGEMEKHYGAPAFVFMARAIVASADGDHQP